jgi:hypothetical protein
MLVIGLLSGFEVLLDTVSGHMRTNPRKLFASEYGLSLQSREYNEVHPSQRRGDCLSCLWQSGFHAVSHFRRAL